MARSLARAALAATLLAVPASTATADTVRSVKLPDVDWTVELSASWQVTRAKPTGARLARTGAGPMTVYIDRSQDTCARELAAQVRMAELTGFIAIHEAPTWTPAGWYPVVVLSTNIMDDARSNSGQLWFCRNLKRGALVVYAPFDTMGDKEDDAAYARASVEVLGALGAAAVKLEGKAPVYKDTVASLRRSHTVEKRLPEPALTAAPAPTAAAPASGPCTDGASCFNAAMAAYQRADYPAALAGFRRACDAKLAGACHNVGHLLHKGQGAPVDVAGSLPYFKRGCELGNKPSCQAVTEVEGKLKKPAAGKP